MAAVNNQMTVNDALAVFDKTFNRSYVKMEEIMEDIGGLRQMFPQLIQHFDQRLMEGKVMLDRALNDAKLYQEYIDKLIRALHEHNIRIPDIPQGMPQKEQPTEQPQTQ